MNLDGATEFTEGGLKDYSDDWLTDPIRNSWFAAPVVPGGRFKIVGVKRP